MTANMREALEAFTNFLNEPPEYEDRRMVREYRHEAYAKWVRLRAKIDAALSAVPAPVSEEEIAQWIGEARTRYTVPSAELAHEFASRLSRTEGDTEESMRTRLDNQHVKSSGGVRTSTGKE